MLRARLPILALTGLVLFQAWAYYYRLPLSLGPRVLLQPWLQNRGAIPYEDIQDLHTPLMPLALQAASWLVPNGLRLAKLADVGLLSLTTLLTYLIASRMIGWKGGLWAAFFVVLWSPSYTFGKLWHEAFLTPLYLLLWILYEDSSKGTVWKALLAGMVGGLAILAKQQAVVVVLAFALWNVVTAAANRRPRRAILRWLGLVGLGAILPLAGYLAFQYAIAGTLSGFFYWTAGYLLTGDYVSETGKLPKWSEIGLVVSSCLVLPAAILAALHARRAGSLIWLQLGWGLTLVVAGSVTAYPRFEMFHLQPAMPAVALVSSVGGAYALKQYSPHSPFGVAIALTLPAYWLITAGQLYQPVLNPSEPRVISEYTDLVPVAGGIREAISPTDCVYVYPDTELTANLYYLLGCQPPTFWTFHYPWYMLDAIKGRIMGMLETSPPEWVANFPDRMGLAGRAPEIAAYIRAHYAEVARFPWQKNEVILLRRIP